MTRVWGRLVTLLAAMSTAGVVAPACADNDKSIFVRAALAPSTNRQNGVCQYTADPQQPALLEGTLDLGVRDSYTAILLIGNQLIQRGDPLAVRVESSRIHLNGAVVRVTNPDGSEIHEFTSMATGFADPENNNQPGYGIVAVTAIDTETKNRLQGAVAGGTTKLVVAVIRVFGTTLGGEDIESGDFNLPIRVCNGCLVSFSGDCATPLLDTGSATGLPCSVGQDEATPCQLCYGRPACTPTTP
jgi:hypothetical protein